jgi:hypothetical protein
VLADAWGDTARPHALPRSVVAKHTFISVRSWHLYYLKVGPWGPYTENNEMSVSHAYFQSKQVGDTVCVLLHPGWLGAPWAELADCRAPQQGNPNADGKA